MFGNLNDPNSRVSRLQAEQRDYALLHELNTRPRTTYLAVITDNPNPELRQTVTEPRSPNVAVSHGARAPCRSSHRATTSRPSPTRSARSFSRARTPLGWWFGFAIAFALANVLLMSLALSGRGGRRRLGHQPARRLGLRDRQFRVVDRHRPRGHADLGDSSALQADMAHVDQSLRRSDDAVRRCVRGPLPHRAPGTTVARRTGCSPTRTR